jgi:hypothetical protein
MSRDRDDRSLLDQPTRPASSGREMPRGGRSGGTTRSRPPVADDARDALTRQLTLPRGPERETVRVGARTVTLRGSETRILAQVGAFRVADARDLEPPRAGDRWHGDVEHLQRAGLVALTPHVLDGERTALVSLTPAGRSVLEHHRQTASGEPAQVFYAGVVKPARRRMTRSSPACTRGRRSASTPVAAACAASSWSALRRR